MRKQILEEPISQAAVWARRLAVFALALAAIGFLVIRSNAVEVAAGLSVIAAAILIACIGLLMAGAAAVIIWRTGRRGVGYIVATFFLCLAFLAYPGYLAVRAVQLPLINDISTDVNDPPQFSKRPETVKARSDIVHPDTLAGALLQESAYADIQPIVIDLDASDGYELVVQAVRALNWRIIERVKASEAKQAVYATRRDRGRRGRVQSRLVSPAKQAQIGRIEAVDRTLLMGFPDDITIRIRPLQAQTRIDLRSASRYGRHDFGANAARIRKFARALQEKLDAR